MIRRRWLFHVKRQTILAVTSQDPFLFQTHLLSRRMKSQVESGCLQESRGPMRRIL